MSGAQIEIDFDKAGGLVPAIIQDHRSGDVLMLGFMNSVSLAETQRSGEVVFFSRSRNKLWKKGESSGHVLKVREASRRLRRRCSSRSRRSPWAPASATKAIAAAFSAS